MNWSFLKMPQFLVIKALARGFVAHGSDRVSKTGVLMVTGIGLVYYIVFIVGHRVEALSPELFVKALPQLGAIIREVGIIITILYTGAKYLDGKNGKAEK